MDPRDVQIWVDAASSHYARQERAMAMASAYPNMAEASDRDNYMRDLVATINGVDPVESDPMTPTPEMEAEWAANRAALAQMFGRIQ
jgi:hypothetical protein